MFETLVNTIQFAKICIYYCLWTSYKTGQFMVAIMILLLEYSFAFSKSLLVIITELIKCLGIFIQDIVFGLQQAAKLCSQLLENLFMNISNVVAFITRSLDAIILATSLCYNFLLNSVFSLFTAVGNALILLKKLIILLGSGVWFSITFIPIFLVYSATHTVQFIEKLHSEIIDFFLTILVNIKSALVKFLQFLIDVPVESIAGLAVALCLVYIFTRFYLIIFSYLYNQARFFFARMVVKMSRIRRPFARDGGPYNSRPARPLVSRRNALRQEQELTSFKKEWKHDDRYCVICQEQMKCILVLPCRHVCMCSDCNSKLQLYNNTCPICRRNIDSTMKIFV